MVERKLRTDSWCRIRRFGVVFSCALRLGNRRLGKDEGFCSGACKFSSVSSVIAGGVWAYFKFAKGRTFEDRLNPTVSGKLVSIRGSVFLIATIRLQNVGLSRIAFDQEVSSLKVFEYVPSQAEDVIRVKYDLVTLFRIFGNGCCT